MVQTPQYQPHRSPLHASQAEGRGFESRLPLFTDCQWVRDLKGAEMKGEIGVFLVEYGRYKGVIRGYSGGDCLVQCLAGFLMAGIV